MKIKHAFIMLIAPALFILTACATRQTSHAPTRPEPQVALTSPVPWQVFQRRTAAVGMVHVAGTLAGAVGETRTVHIELLFPGPADSSRIRQSVQVAADGSFAADLTCPAGGWNSVTVTPEINGQKMRKVTVAPVGVGEVFVVGGQSNSTNYGEVKQKTTTGMVSCFDGKNWTLAADPLPGVDGKGGSPWCIFGDLLAEKFKVPIGIVPVGKGATSVRQWLPKGDIITIEPSRDYGLQKLPNGTWRSEGQLFDRVVDRMKSLGNHGFRAMLWHQGESDAHQRNGHTLPGDRYAADLTEIIQTSRQRVGWNVPWFVAQVSYGPGDGESADIRAAQASLWKNGVALPGPDTDTLLGENRQKNGTGIHMSDIGLHAHAKPWADIVTPWIGALPRK